MKRMRIALVLVCSFWNIIFSQNNFVEYYFFHHDEKQYSQYLAFSEKESYFFIHGGFFDRNENTDIRSIIRNFNIEKFSIDILNKEEKLFDRFDLYQKKIFAWEDRPRINWEIKKEYKDILGYKCQKATAKFRGRNYIAWFAPEINSQYGPWKLSGLPGLILEAYDTDNVYRYIAQSVMLNTDLTLPKIAFDALNSELPNAIILREAIALENKFLNEILNKEIATLPVGSNVQVPPIRSEMRETVFEWEETKKP